MKLRLCWSLQSSRRDSAPAGEPGEKFRRRLIVVDDFFWIRRAAAARIEIALNPDKQGFRAALLDSTADDFLQSRLVEQVRPFIATALGQAEEEAFKRHQEAREKQRRLWPGPLFLLPLLIDRGQIPEQAAGLAKTRIERVGINCHGPAL